MLAELLEDAQRFTSTAVAGLLRSAPALDRLVEHVKGMYFTPQSGEPARIVAQCLPTSDPRDVDKTIEILPTVGADEEHDRRSAECTELEGELDTILRKVRKQLE